MSVVCSQLLQVNTLATLDLPVSIIGLQWFTSEFSPRLYKRHTKKQHSNRDHYWSSVLFYFFFFFLLSSTYPKRIIGALQRQLWWRGQTWLHRPGVSVSSPSWRANKEMGRRGKNWLYGNNVCVCVCVCVFVYMCVCVCGWVFVWVHEDNYGRSWRY